MPIHTPQTIENELLYLGPEIIKDPLSALDQLFDYATLKEYKIMLRNWLKLTVTASYHHESKKVRLNVIDLYERIDIFLDTSHTLYLQTQKKSPGPKKRASEKKK